MLVVVLALINGCDKMSEGMTVEVFLHEYSYESTHTYMHLIYACVSLCGFRLCVSRD